MSELKSAKKVLEEMGFNPDSKESTQFAFLKYLKKDLKNSIPAPKEAEQLEFDLDGLKSWTEASLPKKISNR